MAVSNTTRKIRESGNGIVVAFDFPFKILEETDLVVYKIDTSVDPEDLGTALTLNVDYTVSINSITEGGTVTYTVAPTSDEDSFITRDVALTQPAEFPRESNFPEQQVENQFDRSRMIDIDINEELGRSIKVPINSTATVTLPVPVDGNVVVWDGVLGAMENQPYSLTALDAATADAEAAQAAAELAQTGAETAETNAETAETNAEAAQAAAELAQSGAETAELNAEAAVAQINAEIHDTDDDTKVETERTADDDTIYMKVAGTDEMNITTAGMILKSGARVNAILDEDNMVSDSATALATQQSIKKYVDDSIDAIPSGIEFVSHTTWAAALTSGNIAISTGIKYMAVVKVEGGPGVNNIVSMEFNADTNANYAQPGSDISSTPDSTLFSQDIGGGSIGFLFGTLYMDTIFTDRMVVNGRLNASIVGTTNLITPIEVNALWDKSEAVTSFRITSSGNTSGSVTLYKINVA